MPLVLPQDVHIFHIFTFWITINHVGFGAIDEEQITTIHNEQTNQYQITGLITAQTYQVEIAAFNHVGVGPFTDPVIFQTEVDRPRDSPRILRAEAISESEIKLTWIPPKPQYIGGLQVWTI